MWQDPPYTPPTFKYDFPPAMLRLWAMAMQRDDSELRRSAADTVAVAQKRGMAGLEDLTGQLVEILKSKEQDSAVRRAAAHALVTINARAHAQLLAETANEDGLEVAQFVEPALAKWKYSPIQKTWFERIENPATRQLWRLLAIRCLAESKEVAARQPLLKLVHDRRELPSVRLAAAQALAGIFSNGLVVEAKQHLSAATKADASERLLAVTLILTHSDADAIALLKQLASDEEPAVAAAALDRLFAIDPALTFDLAPQAIKNSDVNVRRRGAEALLVKADETSIRQLAPLLSDTNPSIRSRIANSFAELAAKSQLRSTIIEEAERTLTQDSWRGLEQAILLTVYLERKNTANRMLELLNHPRIEVAVAAAWALRRFAVPETLPKMLQHAQRQHDRLANKQNEGHELSLIVAQNSQLFQAFGQLRYKEAEPLMRQFIPRKFWLGDEARAAACWALGYLYEGQIDEDLAKQFAERLSDTTSIVVEVYPVRCTCAVSLGRMNARSGLPALQRFSVDEGVTTRLGQLCFWSIEKITGEKRPPMPELTRRVKGWFLEPTN